mgnify:CR=1 FL=1
MGDLTIRGMDPALARLLVAEADREGKTPEALALEIISDRMEGSRTAIAERMETLRRSTRGKPIIDPVDLIRQDRDGDHRS